MVIGEQECLLLQQLACIGWALEETSRDAVAVRNMAQLILNDSVQCTRHLRQLASCKGCTLQLRRMPASIELLNQPQRFGVAFDRHYLQEMIQWHEQAILGIRALAAVTTDAEIRRFAGQLERQFVKRLSLVARLQAKLDRRLAHQQHYVW